MDNSNNINNFFEKLSEVHEILQNAPWTSDEIERFVLTGLNLIRKAFLSDQIIQEQKCEINNLNKRNQQLFIEKSDFMKVHKEFDIKIHEIEKENVELKKEKFTTHQYIRQLNERIRKLEEKTEILEMALNKSSNDLNNYQQRMKNISRKVTCFKNSEINEDIVQIEYLIDAMDNKLQRESELNKQLQSELISKISENQIIKEKYDNQLLINSANETRLNCSCCMSRNIEPLNLTTYGLSSTLNIPNIESIRDVFINKLSLVHELMQITPWARDEIENFVQVSEHLINKTFLLQNILKFQKCEINKVLNDNQQLKQTNSDRMAIYEELHIRINEIEKENGELKKEKFAMDQHIRSLRESISTLEVKVEHSEEALLQSENEIDNYKQYIENMSKEMQLFNEKLLHAQHCSRDISPKIEPINSINFEENGEICIELNTNSIDDLNLTFKMEDAVDIDINIDDTSDRSE